MSGMNFTVIQSNESVSKKFSLVDGVLQKSHGGNLKRGIFNTARDFSISDLHDLIVSENCDDKTILISGTTEHEFGSIMTRSEIFKRENESDHGPRVSRTLDDFAYRGGEGFILLDYDPSAEYNDGEVLSKDEFLIKLYSVIPELADAPHLWKTSSSSCIFSSSGEELSGVMGQHVLIHVANNIDIKRCVDVIYKRFWLAGEGYIFPDKTGGMHDRTIIDKVVNSPEREIFVHADCFGGCSQRIQIEVFNDGNAPLNTLDIKDLSAEELEYDKLVCAARDAKSELCGIVRSAYIKKNHEKLGVSKSKLDSCIVNKILYSDNIIKLDNGVDVTVGELYSNYEKYDNMYCHDPLEPDYGGSTGSNTKGWIDLGNSRIYSHAHGGVVYILEHSSKKSPLELVLEICDLKDHLIMFRTAANACIDMRYIETEIDQFIGLLAKSASLKKSSCEKAFRCEYNKLRGTDGKAGSVDIDLNSGYDKDGEFIDDLVQANLSLPITAQFPHTVMRGESRVNKSTIENYQFMCDSYSIKFCYDIILKRQDVIFPMNVVKDGDNKDNASIGRLESLCELNGVSSSKAIRYSHILMHDNQVNPVLDWVKSVKWDGKSRLKLIVDSMSIDKYQYDVSDRVARGVDNDGLDFYDNYKEKVVRMWMVQCIAALDGGALSPLTYKFGNGIPKYEYILIFVGRQGVQKTKFIKSLLPNTINNYILTGHQLEVKDKDSVKIGISHWITELGELDSTFKRSDVGQLKAFMSNEYDEIRLPYAATESRFMRRTSFCASVNDYEFLVDKTGNRRMMPLQVNALKTLGEIKVDFSEDSGEKRDGKLKVVKKVVEKGVVGGGIVSKSGAVVGDSGGIGTFKKDKFGRVTRVKDVDVDKNVNNDPVEPIVDVDVNSNVNIDGVDVGGGAKYMNDEDECKQLWAEIFSYYVGGEQWWPDLELEGMLQIVTSGHERTDSVIEVLEDKFNLIWSDDKLKHENIKVVCGEAVSNISESLRFVYLNVSQLAYELDLVGDKASIGKISNYLGNKGFSKADKTDDKGKNRKCYRLCLNKGESLKSDFNVCGR